MLNWWKQNGWKIRIKIFTIITLPIDILEYIVVAFCDLYSRFFTWLLWDLMHKLFCTKRPKQVWDEIKRVNEE